MEYIKKIEQAQKGLEGTDAFFVGEQLKEICADPECAALVCKDLDVKGMGLTDCAKKIRAYADAHRAKGANFSFVSPKVAEGIIREFYGLPTAGKAAPKQDTGDFLRLEDFL